jgi:pimeloyl-ACP methyl ester carboxylesterase
MAAPLLLVHGGAHGAWCWEPTLAVLSAEALAVDLPPRSIRGGPGRHQAPPGLEDIGVGDWADAVLAEADRVGWDRFVLVGHSLGGLTVAEVCRRAPRRVAHAVYVSAVVPEEGSCVADLLGLPGQPEDGQLGMSEELAAAMFCSDMDEAQTRFVLDHLGLEAWRPLIEPVDRSGLDPSLPTTYVRLARDQALAPPVQEACVAALRAASPGLEVVEIDSGHDVMVSRPAELASVLERVARSAS